MYLLHVFYEKIPGMVPNPGNGHTTLKLVAAAL
jgi:hypothetical protein